MKLEIKIAVLLLGAFLLASCNENNEKPKTITPTVESELIPVQQSTVGNFFVVVYNTQKDLRRGEGSFVIEFHDIKSGEPVKVSGVKLDAEMQLKGESVIGKSTVTPADTAGIYNIKYDLPEKGMWYFNVDFNDSLKVQFILSVI